MITLTFLFFPYHPVKHNVTLSMVRCTTITNSRMFLLLFTTSWFCALVFLNLFLLLRVHTVCNEHLLGDVGVSTNASDDMSAELNPQAIQTGGTGSYCSSTNTVGEYLQVSILSVALTVCLSQKFETSLALFSMILMCFHRHRYRLSHIFEMAYVNNPQALHSIPQSKPSGSTTY